jgi:nicotinamide mononucleotide transporter
MSLIEGFATFFGLLCVWFTLKQNIWCWPTGLVQVVLYIFIFYDARLYSDVLLHIMYVLFSIYGWYQWKGGRSNNDLKVSKLSRSIAVQIFICLLGTLSLGFVMDTYTEASLPYPDAFIAVASLIGQWLSAKKKLESWLFWIAVDMVAIVVYWTKDLYLTTGLYAIFLILATMGYFEWRKSLSQAKVILQ